MVVFWIIGGLFFAIGLIVSIPTLLNILKCKGHATGKILSIDSTDKNARAIYEYAVAGKKYTGKTNGTSNGIFSFYSDKEPLEKPLCKSKAARSVKR